jgi:hypothetical protein
MRLKKDGMMKIIAKNIHRLFYFVKSKYVVLDTVTVIFENYRFTFCVRVIKILGSTKCLSIGDEGSMCPGRGRDGGHTPSDCREDGTGGAEPDFPVEDCRSGGTCVQSSPTILKAA